MGIKVKTKNKKTKDNKSKKLKLLHVLILCKNKHIKEFDISASKKFNINDETYVIKDKCCYIRMIEGNIQEFALYVEGNPNPFDLKLRGKNKGLTESEIEQYIAGDLFNILMECQNEDKSKYIIHLTVLVFILAIVEFFIALVM